VVVERLLSGRKDGGQQLGKEVANVGVEVSTVT